MTTRWFVLVESNTTGSGRLFCDRARTLGLVPVVLARDPDRYPYLGQDAIESRVVDTSDPGALMAACAHLGGRIAGVTSSSEYFIATAARLARSWELPHQDPAAITCCRDKYAQRERLLQAAAAAGLRGCGQRRQSRCRGDQDRPSCGGQAGIRLRFCRGETLPKPG